MEFKWFGNYSEWFCIYQTSQERVKISIATTSSQALILVAWSVSSSTCQPSFRENGATSYPLIRKWSSADYFKFDIILLIIKHNLVQKVWTNADLDLGFQTIISVTPLHVYYSESIKNVAAAVSNVVGGFTTSLYAFIPLSLFYYVAGRQRKVIIDVIGIAKFIY